MPSTTTYRQGQVVVVNVPFTTQGGAKPRPALVASDERFHGSLPDLIVCPISSQPKYYRRPGPGDCPLADWPSVGLRHPSTVRLSNLVAVDKALVRRTLGAVSRGDWARIRAGLALVFGLAS